MSKAHITIHDIAEELNISASTVSRALHDHPRISEATRKAVRDLAEKYNYRPNVVASSLRQGRSKTVGVVVPRINRNFFSNVIGGMEEALAASGYNLMICQSHESLQKEQAAIQTLVNARVDAIILSVSMETTMHQHLTDLENKGIRLLFFDRIVEEIKAGSVGLNDYMGAKQSVQHMIEQGYRRILHVAGPEHINIYRSRKKGYLDAMRDAGIDPDPAWIIEVPLVHEGGEKALQDGLSLNPDAFFCAGDHAALGIIHAAAGRGISSPSDLGVSGFGNEPFTAYLNPSMTTVDQRGVEMGRQVAARFLDCKNEGFSDAPGRRDVIEPRLIIRQSTQLSTVG